MLSNKARKDIRNHVESMTTPELDRELRTLGYWEYKDYSRYSKIEKLITIKERRAT